MTSGTSRDKCPAQYSPDHHDRGHIPMKRFATAMFAASALAIFMPTCAIAADNHAAVTPATDAALTVPPDVIASENTYWQRLGVTPPKDGIVLARPWSEPWSGRSLIVPISWFTRAFSDAAEHRRHKTPMSINAADLRRDLPILHTVLEKNYSGWETAAKRGWNWDDWFRRWDAMLASHGTQSIPDSEAFAPWNAYEAFQIDTHSGPHVTSRPMAISRSAMLQAAAEGSCTRLDTTDGKHYPLGPSDPAQQPHRVRRWDGSRMQTASYMVYPSSRGTVRDITCGGKRIAATPFWSAYADASGVATMHASIASLGGGHEGPAFYNTPAPGIGYLRLATFSEAGSEALIKLQASLPATAGHEKLLIVDLRGNDGGGSPIGALSRWIPVDKVSMDLQQIHKSSCLHPGLWFNLMQVMSMSVKPPTTADFRESAAQWLKDIDVPASTACPVEFHATASHWNYRQHQFVSAWSGDRPRLLVLVDNQCASDCEFMTWQLAQLPGTVIAGSNTLGVIGFTQPGFMLLPHTRIIFQLATSLTDNYGDGRSVDGYGLDIDLALPESTDWTRDSILALARRLETAAPVATGP